MKNINNKNWRFFGTFLCCDLLTSLLTLLQSFFINFFLFLFLYFLFSFFAVLTSWSTFFLLSIPLFRINRPGQTVQKLRFISITRKQIHISALAVNHSSSSSYISIYSCWCILENATLKFDSNGRIGNRNVPSQHHQK